ncbi:peptidoglycan bridge formation glycyltransferase FemA/FemB family protein [Aureibaculum sp. 2210JD6-5]|uniref:lipid II:glycine glycyltransferase FemX n=1 Tax=Aureibaculum sp. 2210JD6-5 TaxID=3103957 RepID=UPI002AAE41FD|nr:peptidoglycan bridge formation glycyltransferase FemA/FemB family protein [Aureibaculum sp. 2210JD6-5]MDY7394087.1 peptidoglycan bridge formation glycyltransferase FemA/FemB family protein [Aureibaculum sp. 2210JD6-5]
MDENDNNFIFCKDFESIDKKEWIALYANSSNRNVFQTSEMYTFWKKQDNYSPIAFGVKSKNNGLIAIFTGIIQTNGNKIMKFFTKRAIFYGGPIIDKNVDQSEVFNFLLQNLNKTISSMAIYSEIRNFSDYSNLNDVYINHKYEYIPYQNYKIDLTSEDDVFKLLKSEKRRQIRRSQREGVVISYENSSENIIGVYNVIYKIYKEKVKKPLHKLAFFENLCKQKFASVVALQYQKKIIGGGFFLMDDKCIYDWYRGGLDYDFKHQYPSTLAAWSVIKYGLDNNLQTFDFMGAGIRGEDYGVRDFKSQFGGQLVEDGRYSKVFNSHLFKIGKLGLNILKKLNN